MKSLPLAALAPLVLSLTGCLSHLPPTGNRHLGIHWARGFDDAQRRARSEDKPLLVVLVAGEIAGEC